MAGPCLLSSFAFKGEYGMKKLIPICLILGILLLATVSCASSRGNTAQTVPATTTAAPYTTMTTAVPGPAGLYYSNGQKGTSIIVPTPMINVPPANVTVNVPAPAVTFAPATTTPPLFYGGDQGTNSAVSSTSWGTVYTPQDSQVTDRMVVRNGDMQIVVSDVAATLDNITKIASDFGGYVVTSQKWKDGERNMGNISIRILAENYVKSIAAIRALAMSVISETTSSQDVTQEYVDLDSQVKNLQATETQLLKIMESATKTEDVLSVQRELTTVRGEIEQDQGRMQYLQRTSSTSLIQVTLNEAVLDLKFNADKIMVNTGEAVRFTLDVSGGFAPYNYLWDFGDGKTSVDKSPDHGYADAGTYTVTLKVTDDKGYTNSLTRSQYITASGNWNPSDIAKGAWGGFTGFGRVFINILIWLGIFSPIWIIVGVIVWWSVWRKKKRSQVQ
jgi:PKD repeat protein